MGKSFFKKIRFKYKFLVLNEHTFEEKFNFRLSALNIFLLFSFSSTIVFLLISLLIFVTPIKHYLPGYADVSVKGELLKESMRVDSLMNDIQMQKKQFDMFKQIVRDEMPIDSIKKVDSLTLKSWKKLPINKSEKESAFAEQYKNDAKYNLSTIDKSQSNNSAKTKIFLPPCNGTIVDTTTNNHHAIYILTNNHSPVISIAEGTIIQSTNNPISGYSITVQHNDGFISIYNNIDNILKSTSNTLSAGEVIGFVGNNSNTPLRFELWLNGTPQNPKNYIVF